MALHANLLEDSEQIYLFDLSSSSTIVGEYAPLKGQLLHALMKDQNENEWAMTLAVWKEKRVWAVGCAPVNSPKIANACAYAALLHEIVLRHVGGYAGWANPLVAPMQDIWGSTGAYLAPVDGLHASPLPCLC